MPANIALTRHHRTLAIREEQITRNLLAVRGGKPYIHERLARFPAESDTSWFGTNTFGTKSLDGVYPILGRRERAYNVNYARRITDKLNQYVFGQPAEREGASEEFLADVTRMGETVTEFMEQVNVRYVAQGWCWVSADRGAPPVDANGNPLPRTRSERESSGDGVYWIVWDAAQVVDWHYSDTDGRLDWLITETRIFDNADPEAQPQEIVERSLWRRGGTGKRWRRKVSESDEKAEETAFTWAGAEIPFFMVGEADPLPHWFDEVELIQAAILNYLSLDQENLSQTVFPQLVMPAGILEWMMQQGNIGYKEAIEAVRGLNYPVFEPTADSGITRYVTPPAGDLKVIGERVLELKRELYEVVGLAMAMGAESKQVQSAESRRWEHLDPEATLRSLSGKLESVEAALVRFSKQLDATFTEYQPVYSKKFDLDDTADLAEALVGLSALSLPAEAEKEIQKAALKVLARVATIAPDRMRFLLDEIEKGDPSMFDRRLSEDPPV
jgi:hypothetical protein